MKLKLKTAFKGALAILAILAVGTALAALPNYQTKSAAGNATAGAQVIFPSDPVLTPRIVNVNWSSDTNAAVLNFSSGVGAYYVSVTNAATSSTTNQISGTNGLVASSVLVLEHLGLDYAATISNFGSNATWGNYYVLPAGGWGVATSVGDSLYQMGTAASIPIGATTNVQNGDAIYVGNPGRPVLIQLTPAAATNKLNSVVARYE